MDGRFASKLDIPFESMMRSRQPIHRTSACALSLWLAVCTSRCAWPQADQTVQYPLKLAFIYNVTKFVEWPTGTFDSASSAVVICIVGHDPFPADAERELRSRMTGGRPVDLRKITALDDPGICQVVFITNADQKNTASILTKAENTSTLTVGENEGFVERGGVVNLAIQDMKIHFEINTGAAKRKHLIISSRLLALAKIVSSPAAR
jgi:hypothetical protein